MRAIASLPLMLAALAFGSAVCATAEAAPKAAPLPTYADIDKDKDGTVTLAEMDVYPPGVAARLHKCDTNKDQVLSKEEYAHCEHAMPQQAK